jgi:hypothetical protein
MRAGQMMATQKQRALGTTRARREPVFSDAAALRALHAICFGFFLVVLDTTALNVAVAAILREFGGTITGLQWVVNSYTMVFASLLLTCGALGDRAGARLFYQIGLALFTAMSLLCALAPGAGFLIAMRMLQGLGAAIMLPASLSFLSHSFPHASHNGRRPRRFPRKHLRRCFGNSQFREAGWGNTRCRADGLTFPKSSHGRPTFLLCVGAGLLFGDGWRYAAHDAGVRMSSALGIRLR